MFLIKNFIWDMYGKGTSVRGVTWNLVLDSLPVAFYPKVVVTCCDMMLQEKHEVIKRDRKSVV